MRILERKSIIACTSVAINIALNALGPLLNRTTDWLIEHPIPSVLITACALLTIYNNYEPPDHHAFIGSDMCFVCVEEFWTGTEETIYGWQCDRTLVQNYLRTIPALLPRHPRRLSSIAPKTKVIKVVLPRVTVPDLGRDWYPTATQLIATMVLYAVTVIGLMVASRKLYGSALVREEAREGTTENKPRISRTFQHIAQVYACITIMLARHKSAVFSFIAGKRNRITILCTILLEIAVEYKASPLGDLISGALVGFSPFAAFVVYRVNYDKLPTPPSLSEIVHHTLLSVVFLPNFFPSMLKFVYAINPVNKHISEFASSMYRFARELCVNIVFELMFMNVFELLCKTASFLFSFRSLIGSSHNLNGTMMLSASLQQDPTRSEESFTWALVCIFSFGIGIFYSCSKAPSIVSTSNKSSSNFNTPEMCLPTSAYSLAEQTAYRELLPSVSKRQASVPSELQPPNMDSSSSSGSVSSPSSKMTRRRRRMKRHSSSRILSSVRYV